MKKIISILLAAVLIFSTAVIAAFAAPPQADSTSSYRGVLGEFIAQADQLLTNGAFVPNNAEHEALSGSLTAAKAVYDDPSATDDHLSETSDQLKAQMESPLVRSMLAETARITQNALDIAGFALTEHETGIYMQAVGLFQGYVEQPKNFTLTDYENMSGEFKSLTAESDAQFAPTSEELGLLLGRGKAISQQPERYAKDGFDLFLSAYQTAGVIFEKGEQASPEEIEASFRRLAEYASYLRENPDAPHYGKYGDVTCDGSVTLPDALLLQKALAKILVLTAGEQKYGDVDADGKISVYDVLLIQQYIAKMIGRFPAEPAPGPDDIEDTTVDDVPFSSQS